MTNPLLTKQQRERELCVGLVILLYNGQTGCIPDNTDYPESFAALVDSINGILIDELDQIYATYTENKNPQQSPMAIFKSRFADYIGISYKRVGKDKGYFTLSKQGIDDLFHHYKAFTKFAIDNMAKSTPENIMLDAAIFSIDNVVWSFNIRPESEVDTEES